MAPRALPVLLLLATALSGCVLTGGDEPLDCTLYADGPDTYRYRYEGDDVVVPGGTYGWAVLFTNPYDQDLMLEVRPFSEGPVSFGPVVTGTEGPAAWSEAGGGSSAAFLDVGAGSLWLFSTRVPQDASGDTLGFGFKVRTSMYLYEDDRSVWDTDGGHCEIDTAHLEEWTVRVERDRPDVRAGDKVRTLTVGLWANGTSFYTNIADLDGDRAFPAGYDNTTFDGTPLPVYVYDQDRSEQPVGNRDRCFFTTITGYNALLKTQQELGTNVRFLPPEEAYTVPGAEEHFLYGESLVFLNTVVAHEGAVADDEEAPDPDGACFDHRNACRKTGSLGATCSTVLTPPGRVSTRSPEP